MDIINKDGAEKWKAIAQNTQIWRRLIKAANNSLKPT